MHRTFSGAPCRTEKAVIDPHAKLTDLFSSKTQKKDRLAAKAMAKARGTATKGKNLNHKPNPRT